MPLPIQNAFSIRAWSSSKLIVAVGGVSECFHLSPRYAHKEVCGILRILINSYVTVLLDGKSYKVVVCVDVALICAREGEKLILVHNNLAVAYWLWNRGDKKIIFKWVSFWWCFHSLCSSWPLNIGFELRVRSCKMTNCH